MEHRHGPGNGVFWNEGAARHAHDDWWGGPLEFLVLLLLAALVVGAVVWLVRRLAPAAAAPTTVAPTPLAAPAPALAADPAVAALRLRYARGEVSREDFRQTLGDLTGATAGTTEWPGETPTDETPPA